MSKGQTPEDRKLIEEIDRAVERLGEHFESVAIFATKRTEDGKGNTASYKRSVGNYYATRGMVHEWLERQKEVDRLDEQRRDRDEEE